MCVEEGCNCVQCRMGIQPHKRDDKREAISDGLYFIETLCEMNPILGEREEKKNHDDFFLCIEISKKRGPNNRSPFFPSWWNDIIGPTFFFSMTFFIQKNYCFLSILHRALYIERRDKDEAPHFSLTTTKVNFIRPHPKKKKTWYK